MVIHVEKSLLESVVVGLRVEYIYTRISKYQRRTDVAIILY